MEHRPPTESPNVPPSADYWRDYLEKGEPYIRIGRRVFGAIPSDPRCRMCTAPFAGVGAPLMRVIGRKRSAANPHLCSACENALLNTAARLAGTAGAGEILVSAEAASTIGLEGGLERRSLQLKGKEQPFDAVVVGAGTPVS